MTDEWVGTYRLQLHAGFTLKDAERILPYLAELGVSHVYLSPSLQAFPGSMHGYDVTDPARISADLGGEAAWQSFVEAARARHLGILLDFVPNHMSASEHNAWWDDVLARGPYSEFAGYFDIRTMPCEPFKVHVCTLARAYGEALEKGELVIELRGGRPRVLHFDNSWPLAMASWGVLLDDPDPCFAELIELQSALAPGRAEHARHRRCAERAEAVLAEAAESGRLAAAIGRTRGDPVRLDAILRRQFFALHGWKLAGELTNYRRFFDVSGLVGIRIERPAVFAAAHVRIERMIREGQLDGLRLDHPDGLKDPLGYFERLRGLLPDGRLYVEKILENDERLPEDWPIDGTVGYDFMAKANRLWMDDRRIDAFTGT
jgi:(1->4)-alpha-D-glucan 1-alpha-D-glucosylmutase